MRIEDRLTEHFQATAERLEPSGRDVASIVGTSMHRQSRRRFLVGGTASVAVASAGFLLARNTVLIRGLPRPSAKTDPDRMVISPYVNLSSRLDQQSDQRLFTVTTDAPAYWRLATLSVYEDEIWKSQGFFGPTDGRLMPDPPDGLEDGFKTIEQRFQIEQLDSIWLPAAAEPFEIELAGPQPTWDESSNSLAVANGQSSSDGLAYRVTSHMPVPSPDQLREIEDRDPPEILERYLIPTDGDAVPPILRELAGRIVAGALGRYESVLALQAYFRDNFEHRLDLGPIPAGTDDVDHFLATKAGSAQRFSGAFALMARTLGIPSRVAIGFTWGDPIKTEGSLVTYAVQGRQAHAWPEIYFDRLGWVPFEPTPGRGLPHAIGYTGVSAEQVSLVAADQLD